MSSIFTIKHVVDYAHDEVMRFITENERLKARITELEKLISVKSNQIVHETEKDDDGFLYITYASENTFGVTLYIK